MGKGSRLFRCGGEWEFRSCVSCNHGRGYDNIVISYHELDDIIVAAISDFPSCPVSTFPPPPSADGRLSLLPPSVPYRLPAYFLYFIFSIHSSAGPRAVCFPSLYVVQCFSLPFTPTSIPPHCCSSQSHGPVFEPYSINTHPENGLS